LSSVATPKSESDSLDTADYVPSSQEHQPLHHRLPRLWPELHSTTTDTCHASRGRRGVERGGGGGGGGGEEEAGERRRQSTRERWVEVSNLSNRVSSIPGSSSLASETHLANESSDLPQAVLVSLGASQSELYDPNQTPEPRPLHCELLGVAVCGALDQVLQTGQGRGNERSSRCLEGEAVGGCLLPEGTVGRLLLAGRRSSVCFSASH
jgi:hypothetical protein